MKNVIICLILFLSFNLISAQPDGRDVLKEGQLLYRLEKASWYGTDFFLAEFPQKRGSIGGYLSYLGDNNHVYSIFFEKNFSDKVLIRFEFDSIPIKIPLAIDTVLTTATKQEMDLIKIRQDALERINTDSVKFFSFYKNTSYNIIPLITPKERKVYSITGPQASGVVLIGNDYLFKYDQDNNFISKEKIHNSLIQLPSKMDSNQDAIMTMHSHVISDIIDPTDICTLLLYKDYVPWRQHYVISKKFVSIFDMDKENLVIITRKAWDKMNEDKK